MHNIQPFFPAEKVIAMYAAAQAFEHYPIRLA
jgi:hypothetical protein